MSELARINRQQRLYVIKAGEGFSCLGFDYAEKQRMAILAWLGMDREAMRVGTRKHWCAYQQAMSYAFIRYKETGERCPVNLIKELVGLEGKRVELIEEDGKRRFWVGKTTGWMPTHLEIPRRDSTGGMPVYMPAGARVRVVK